MQIVRAMPPPHHVLHVLLQSGMLRVCMSKLKDLDTALCSTDKADALKASNRRSHTAMAVSERTGQEAEICCNFFTACGILYVPARAPQ